MTEAIAEHYSFGGLRARIERGLADSGEPATVANLGAVDEFHLGGRPATAHLVDQLHLGPDHHVLDLGSGLGGLARFIAETTGARVTGVDLTAEYVEVARWLTGLVGLDNRVSFEHGSAADPPAGQYDAATMLHVGMNIADKRDVFARVRQQLKPAAQFAIYDIMATGADEPQFPCPWAASPATSFLETAEAYADHLIAAGFSIDAVEDRSDAARAALTQLASSATGGPPPLGLHLVMGPSTPTKISNMRDALIAGVIAPTEILATA